MRFLKNHISSHCETYKYLHCLPKVSTPFFRDTVLFQFMGVFFGGRIPKLNGPYMLFYPHNIGTHLCPYWRFASKIEASAYVFVNNNIASLDMYNLMQAIDHMHLGFFLGNPLNMLNLVLEKKKIVGITPWNSIFFDDFSSN